MGWHERRFEYRSTAVPTSCAHCGKAMWLPKSKIGMYLTCGGECAATLKRANIEARTRPCEKCGKTFIPRPTQLRAGHGRFCSQACNASGREITPDVRARMVLSRLASKDGWAWKCRGERNGKWRGGRKATYERWKAAGGIRNQNNRRRDFRRNSLPKGFIPWLEQMQRSRCASCKASIRDGYHLDHIVPVSKGGGNTTDNVQLLCPPCNMKKRDLMPAEWAKQIGRLL